jgi:nucleotide-binding universal stress UspA family protein
VVHIKKILYPTDFSSYSNQAYFHALALAETHGATLTIAHVYTPAHDQADRSFWRSQLEQIHPENRQIAVQHVFLEGNPAEELVRFAAEAGIDLIVVGTHGRTGIDRLLMGSVTEQILRGAPCSVMVVKLPKGATSPSPDFEIKGNEPNASHGIR